MLFALLIHNDETIYDSMSPQEYGKVLAAHNAFSERNGAVLRGGEALHPTTSATTVRVRDGERMLTDGPFAETREQFGGYYLIDVPGLDEALDVAAQVPEVTGGSVEVRPVMVFDAGQPA